MYTATERSEGCLPKGIPEGDGAKGEARAVEPRVINGTSNVTHTIYATGGRNE